MLDCKGSSFGTFCVDHSDVAIEYENRMKLKADCFQQNGGAWWFGNNSASCSSKTKFNAFKCENLLNTGNKANLTLVTLRRDYEKCTEHR